MIEMKLEQSRTDISQNNLIQYSVARTKNCIRREWNRSIRLNKMNIQCMYFVVSRRAQKLYIHSIHSNKSIK